MLPTDSCSTSSPDPVFPPVPICPVSQTPQEPCCAAAPCRSLQHLHQALKQLELLMSTQDKLCWQCMLRHVAGGHPTRLREPQQGPHPCWHDPSITIPPASPSLGSSWQSPTGLRLSPLSTGCSRTIKKRLKVTCPDGNDKKNKATSFHNASK